MEPIGIISGKTTTHEFKFIVQNPVKKWDYVLANHPEVGPVLAQVLEIEASKNKVADCSIIGYRNKKGLLRKPKTPLEPGTQIFPANDYNISKILGLKKEGLYLGFLEGKNKLKAFVDPKKIITKHLAVIAKSGAGKSYAVGTLLEELATYGVPCIILDPHGEYNSIRYPNNNEEDKKYFKNYGISPKGFNDKVNEFAIDTSINTEAKKIKLEFPQQPYSIIQTIPFKLTASQSGLIHNTINQLEENKSKVNFQDIIEELKLVESNSKWSLISGLQQLIKTDLFSFSPTPVEELIKPNNISIINFKGASPELQEIAAKSLLTELFEKRKLKKIPPFFLVIEEAHNFCPERGYGEAKSSRIIRNIASEGRKFGLGLCIISQRPARVEKSVLSQCTSQMSLQVTNPGDLKAISNSFEGITSETEKEIKNLPIGRALLLGASDYPIFINIRVRRSQHGGRAKTFDLKKPISDPIATKSDKITNNTIKKRTIAKRSSYIFTPKISPKEVKIMEDAKITSASLVLKPCIFARCSSKNKNFNLLFDLTKPQILTFEKELSSIKLPKNISKLSPVQKKVLDIINSKPIITASEVFANTNISFNQITGIINDLKRMDFISISENKIKSNMRDLFNLEKISFTERPEYTSEPESEKQSIKVKKSDITEFLNVFNIKVESQKPCWFPFYKVETPNGKKILDGFSYTLQS